MREAEQMEEIQASDLRLAQEQQGADFDARHARFWEGVDQGRYPNPYAPDAKPCDADPLQAGEKEREEMSWDEAIDEIQSQEIDELRSLEEAGEIRPEKHAMSANARFNPARLDVDGRQLSSAAGSGGTDLVPRVPNASQTSLLLRLEF